MRKRFKELCIEVTKNREELKEQRELIDFLLEHDRNDVVLDWTAERFNVYSVIKYIYDNKIKVVSTKLPYEYSGYEVIENTKEKIVLKILLYNFAQSYKFYKINKKDGMIMDITDIVNKTKEDERKKVEAELEEKAKKEEPPTVSNPDTPTETDFKYFTAEQVRNMSQKEVRDNFTAIRKSMEKW
ncbi:MAG: hypothetical protein U0M06_05040 [Clostridia bacterium]|nr:hypothetical protein [Clostridia bacterium]